MLVVNHMIFLKDLSFQGSQSGPQGRELRAIDEDAQQVRSALSPPPRGS